MAFSKRIRKYLVISLIIGWVVSLSFSTKAKERLYYNNQVLMGTFWETTSPNKNAGKIVFKEAARVEELLSKYKIDSEVSKLNRSGKLKVSADTFYIIKKSKEFYEASSGAFDITVAPLVSLWGFTNQEYSLPSANKIQETLSLVGSDKIILHTNDNVVEFKLPGMKIDLGAIAKGFALDCAVKELKKRNINNCLINAGGQIYALGDRFGKAWKIAIKDPRKVGVSSTLELRNQSASTSGDYEQFFLIGNKRYSHILNPKTGYPVDSDIMSITVVASTGLEADALSTAVFVMGRENGQELLKKINGAAAKIF